MTSIRIRADAADVQKPRHVQPLVNRVRQVATHTQADRRDSFYYDAAAIHAAAVVKELGRYARLADSAESGFYYRRVFKEPVWRVFRSFAEVDAGAACDAAFPQGISRSPITRPHRLPQLRFFAYYAQAFDTGGRYWRGRDRASGRTFGMADLSDYFFTASEKTTVAS